jgi:hypothetical protein
MSTESTSSTPEFMAFADRIASNANRFSKRWFVGAFVRPETVETIEEVTDNGAASDHHRATVGTGCASRLSVPLVGLMATAIRPGHQTHPSAAAGPPHAVSVTREEARECHMYFVHLVDGEDAA